MDISLLRITLFHEHWQGLLHELDLATLRANSAVALKPPASNSNSSAADSSVAPHTDQPAAVHPSSSAAPPAPSSSASSAQLHPTTAADSSFSLADEEERGSIATSSSQESAAAGVQTADRLQEADALQASASRQVSDSGHCMIASKPSAFSQHLCTAHSVGGVAAASAASGVVLAVLILSKLSTQLPVCACI